MSLNTDCQSITQVYSHEQSLTQCQHWLKKHLPHATLTAVVSNAEAAKMASKDATSAAISSTEAAEIYGLPIIQQRIEDLANNTTRFIVVSKQSNPSSGYDKTSLLISAKNQPGALFELLKPLAKYGLDMSRIESRPSQIANWEYVFFLDIKGHVEDSNVQSALEELEQQADLLRILGSYPISIL
jgi:chorismate mutase/prephenate dehydratase